jgi:hypothetical protein
MSQAFFAALTSTSPGNRPFRSRFEPCLKLSTGEIDFPITRVDPLFEDLPMGHTATNHPTAWLVTTLRKLAHAARQYDINIRPIHVPMPLCILQYEDAARHCKVAAEAEGWCPQEFVMEFHDASLASSEIDVLSRMESYRRVGFRIGLDARQSSTAPFGARLRSAVERMRVQEDDLLTDETLQHRAEIVSSLGGDVIIERAHWKLAELLQSYGATHALKMVCDA